jgi:hypothetical protein
MKHLKSFFFDQTGRFFGQRRRLYETRPKWHGFSMIKLTALMAGPGLNSKQIERRTSNVQHRTSNIDDATLYLILNKRTAACNEPFGKLRA